jgi:hypothetical protein
LRRLEGTVVGREEPMGPDSKISWSSFSRFEGCGQSFLWRYGWEGVDFGYGPGGKMPRKAESRHNAVPGLVVQAVLERLYNDELYQDPARLRLKLDALAEREWSRIERKNPIDYSESRKSRGEMLVECRKAIQGYLNTMKHHRLLGPYAQAEVMLTGWINKWVQIWGYADMIIRRDDTGVTILDGKFTKYRDKMDPDQLRFYALLFLLSYNVMPDRIGFVWYRFPYDPESEEEGVEWVPFEKEDLQGLALRVTQARDKMRFRKFEAKPTPEGCKYCEFLDRCPERQAQILDNSKGREKKVVEELQGGGFSDFSL